MCSTIPVSRRKIRLWVVRVMKETAVKKKARLSKESLGHEEMVGNDENRKT